jgi:2-oxoglutarate dehydrogenase E2 component (dihydrolipoamide succinyltransferase)
MSHENPSPAEVQAALAVLAAAEQAREAALVAPAPIPEALVAPAPVTAALVAPAPVTAALVAPAPIPAPPAYAGRVYVNAPPAWGK